MTPETNDTGDLATWLATYPNTARVSIYRHNDESSRWDFLGPCAPQNLSEEWIQTKYAKRFGGGLFAVKLHEDGGKIITSKWNIPIADPVDVDEIPLEPRIPAAGVGIDPVSLLRDELHNTHALMREMISAFSKAPAAGAPASMTDMVTALAALKKLEPAPPPLATDLFVKGMEMALKLNGTAAGEAETESTSWLTFAREVLHEAKPIIAKAFTEGPAPEAAATDDGAQLAQAIAFLKTRAAAGNSVALWVSYITENLDRATIEQIVNTPFEQFIAIDPELGAEPFMTWFQTLQGALRASIHVVGDSAGAGRDAGNPPPNGGISPQSAARPESKTTGASARHRAAAS